jgi:hypothetical protein
MWFTTPVLRAFGQKASQVVVRRPGHRFLSAPEPIGPFADEHWEFAWLSVAAYLQTPAGQKQTRNLLANTAAPIGAFSPDPLPTLTAAGWVKWSTFPGDELLAKIKNSHLRVQVWEREDPPAVAVTFGGTVFNNDADWRANLRWFLPGRKGDEYTAVVQTFAPAFELEFKRRAQSMDTERLSKLVLYSTGHSLGGGLAQQFAYSLPSVIDKPSTVNAAIRGVRYSLFGAWSPLAAHSIDELAAKLYAARLH